MPITDSEILVGTYEAFLLGFRVIKSSETKGHYELTPSFTTRAHVGPVRCVTSVNRFVITGSSDELCKVYDLKKRNENGLLDHHNGTVTCLAGHDKKYLMTASDDKTLSLINLNQWQVEKTLYTHQGGITAIAIHPSGKIAFSAGKDRKLVTWNLVKAKPAFFTNLKGIADLVVVSPDGRRYCVGLHRRIDVYNLETAGVEYSIDLKCRPNALAFLGEGQSDILVVAGESSKVQIHSLIEKAMIKEFEAHPSRVRCITTLSETLPSQAEDETENNTSNSESGFIVVTASSSDNMVKLWRVHTDAISEVECIGSFDTTCRITCMTTWNHSMIEKIKPKKRKPVPQLEDVKELIYGPTKKMKKTKISFAIADDEDVKEDVNKNKKSAKEKKKPKISIEQEFNERGTITDEDSETEEPEEQNKNGHDSDIEITPIVSSARKSKRKNIFAEQEL